MLPEVIEYPSVAIDIESDEMTVADLCRVLQQVYGQPIAAGVHQDVIVRGHFTDSRELVQIVQGHTGAELVNAGGYWLFTDPVEGEEALTYVTWASGRSREDADSFLASLGYTNNAIDENGICLVGVEAGEVDYVERLLAAIDEGDDWVFEVAIVDSSSGNGGDGQVSLDTGIGGGVWFATGSHVVDRFKLTAQSGEETVQRYGSRVPFRTTVVTEQGVFLSGQVQYQDIDSVISVQIVEGGDGARARIQVQARRAGDESDGLFEILTEEINTELLVRSEPVKVGSLRRWSAFTTAEGGWPLAQLLRTVRGRRYDVWFHAVRLPKPIFEVRDLPATGEDWELEL